MLVAHATSPLSGWTVGLGLGRERLAEPLRRSLLALAPLAAGLVGLAALGTALAARRIERPVAGLADLAAALGRGEAPAPPRTPIAEVNAVAEALARAGRARREAEAARRLLLLEMQHRVKNVLATVQSIATLSARGAASPEAFARGFGVRLRAIAQTHALLLEGGAASAAPLRAILAGELAPYGAEADGAPEGGGGGASRVRLSGPDLLLPAEAAQAIGLVAHELATNAAKHGALSREGGRVEVAWDAEGEGEARRLVLDWTETGGPPVAAPPARSGFGSRLMDQALAGRLGGRVAFDWRPAGLRARLEMPLPDQGPQREGCAAPRTQGG